MEIARKSGVGKSRISELTLNPSAQLKVRELYLIVLAIDAEPGEVLKEISNDLILKMDNRKINAKNATVFC